MTVALLNRLMELAGGVNDDLATELYMRDHHDTVAVTNDDGRYIIHIYQDGRLDNESVRIIDDRITAIADMIKATADGAMIEILARYADPEDAEDDPDAKRARGMLQYQSGIRNDVKRKAIRNRIASRTYLPSQKIDTNRRIISLPNGSLIVDMTARTVEYSPEHFPEANNTFIAGSKWVEGSTCPRIEQYVLEALSYDNTKELRVDMDRVREEARAFRAAFGYSWLSGNPQQMIFMIRGSSRSGKGTWATLMKKAMGTYAKGGRRDLVVVQKNDRIRADLGMSIKKHAVVVDELRPTDVIDTGALRYYTNDPIIAEVKFGNPAEGQNNITMWIISNFENRMDSTDEAMLSRIVMFEFFRPAPQVEDPGLADDLWGAEGDGLLQYAIAGLRDYFANGKAALCPAHMREKMADYLGSQDLMAEFTSACLPKDKKEGRSFLLTKVFEEMNIFFGKRGEDAPCHDTRGLARMLRERGYKVQKSNGPIKVFDVKLVSSTPVPTSQGLMPYVEFTASEMRVEIIAYLTAKKSADIYSIRGRFPRERDGRVADILGLMVSLGEVMIDQKGIYTISIKT